MSSERARELRRQPTDAENVLWRALRARQLGGLKFRRQHSIGPYVVDFACEAHRLIVEVDGGQHDARHDARRTRFLETCGYHVLRFWNSDVLRNIDGVQTEILRAIGREP